MTEHRDLPDAGWAFVIGALTGVGIALLLRSAANDPSRMLDDLHGAGLDARLASRRQSRELSEIVSLVRNAERGAAR